MKKIFVITAGAISLLTLASCSTSRPLTTAPTENNETYKVDYLFEHDGVKVYRFRDRGNFVYFTSRGDGVTAITNDSARTTVRTVERGTYFKDRQD